MPVPGDNVHGRRAGGIGRCSSHSRTFSDSSKCSSHGTFLLARMYVDLSIRGQEEALAVVDQFTARARDLQEGPAMPSEDVDYFSAKVSATNKFTVGRWESQDQPSAFSRHNNLFFKAGPNCETMVGSRGLSTALACRWNLKDDALHTKTKIPHGARGGWQTYRTRKKQKTERQTLDAGVKRKLAATRGSTSAPFKPAPKRRVKSR